MIAWVQTPAQNNHLHKRDSLSFEREVQNINLKSQAHVQDRQGIRIPLQA